jgi:hypothetical protein
MDASDLAREVNARIRELCARLDPERAIPTAFLCECGCLAFGRELAHVVLTPAEYDDRTGEPLLAPGHSASPRL